MSVLVSYTTEVHPLGILLLLPDEVYSKLSDCFERSGDFPMITG